MESTAGQRDKESRADDVPHRHGKGGSSTAPSARGSNPMTSPPPSSAPTARESTSESATAWTTKPMWALRDAAPLVSPSLAASSPISRRCRVSHHRSWRPETHARVGASGNRVQPVTSAGHPLGVSSMACCREGGGAPSERWSARDRPLPQDSRQLRSRRDDASPWCDTFQFSAYSGCSARNVLVRSGKVPHPQEQDRPFHDD